ncbi:MAG: SDR family NAD(P)-dependent oxidoreductase [Candidatus Gracilibacteria bacterium]|nr:SDR family NAD(P)-dependent oxidoreductase [Candidatus Gracilibacteria bacterium]
MQNILITGITSGIGHHLAINLSNENHITGVGRREKPDIQNINYIKGNIRDLKTLHEIEKSKESYDFVIINAGVGYFDEFKNINLDQNKEIIETNLLSPILLTNILICENKIKKGIIFIGSVVGKKSMKFGASYGASKFGLRGFAMQLKNELTKLSIHIINPKIVKTEFHKNSKIEVHGKYKETSLDDILQTIVDIISQKEKRFEIDL